jgi:hypothetical protein
LQLNDVVLAYGRSIKHKSKWRSSVCLATYCKITNALVLQYTDAFESAFLQGCTEKVMIDSLLGPGCSGWRNPSRPLLRLQAVVCRGCNGEGAHALFCIHCKFRGQSHELRLFSSSSTYGENAEGQTKCNSNETTTRALTCTRSRLLRVNQ